MNLLYFSLEAEQKVQLMVDCMKYHLDDVECLKKSLLSIASLCSSHSKSKIYMQKLFEWSFLLDKTIKIARAFYIGAECSVSNELVWLIFFLCFLNKKYLSFIFFFYVNWILFSFLHVRQVRKNKDEFNSSQGRE